MLHKKNYSILFFVLFFFILESIKFSEPSQQRTDYILCRRCGYNIAPATHVFNLQSPAAEKFFNHTLFGIKEVQIQKIRNPLGIEFNIIISSGGTCVGRQEKWKSHNSWYPGYLWKPCYCIRCSNHIGWVFEPMRTAHEDRVYASSKGFYAIILDSIVSEIYSDSLLANPRVYSHQEL